MKSKVILLIVSLSLTAVGSMGAQGYSFQVEKSGSGDPVILIPGLSCSGEVWEETVSHLRTRYECHVLTLPGFAGQPPLDPLPEDYLGAVRDELLRYIAEQDLKHPIVIGHSLGGFLGMTMAIEAPGRLRKLLIVDALPFLAAIQAPAMTEEVARSMAANMKASVLKQSPEQYEQAQPAILATMINDKDNIATALQWGRDSDRATVAQAMYDLYASDLRDELAGVEIPILVLGAWVAYKPWGATRESTLARYESQYAKAPHCRVRLTDVGKHFIMWDDPGFYFEQLHQFLLEP